MSTWADFASSYENSLIQGRLSALPSLPLPFLASIGVLGSSDSPPKLRCPLHLTIPFGAFYYAGQEGEGAKSSAPYVGTIDLEAHYYSAMRDEPSVSDEREHHRHLPKFPGYRVPQKGRIQIVVKNDNSTGIKLFLVPYDLTGLERNGQGGKTFLRQKSYSIDIDPITNTPLSASNTTPPTSSPNPSNDNKGKLRYAVHLHFCSPPSSSPPSPTKSSPTTSVKREQPAYYLYSTIRVVFAPSRALDSLSSYRVVAEGPTGALDGDFNSSPAGGSAFMPYKGAGEEWERERKKAKARQRCRELVGTPLRQGQQDESEREEGDAMVTRRDSYDAAHDYSPGLTSELLTTIPSYSPPPSLSLDSLSSTLPSPKLSTASFAPVVRSRLSVVTRSGLSSSRPQSFHQPEPPSTPTPNPNPQGALVRQIKSVDDVLRLEEQILAVLRTNTYPHQQEAAKSALVRAVLSCPDPQVVASVESTFHSYELFCIARTIPQYPVNGLNCTAATAGIFSGFRSTPGGNTWTNVENLGAHPAVRMDADEGRGKECDQVDFGK
ncbi:hypothetical protein MNV49_002631 [Pseudohyphozyma bogoriensis]|nr:hypothetical protein MNV49_002631 [Pseudohyphozyma bogoriensis]